MRQRESDRVVPLVGRHVEKHGGLGLDDGADGGVDEGRQRARLHWTHVSPAHRFRQLLNPARVIGDVLVPEKIGR